MSASSDAYTLKELNDYQKKNYTDQNWDAFFGAAQLYRQIAWDRIPSHRLIALEAMAMLRHCQYDLALRLIEMAHGEFEPIQKLIPEIKKLQIQIKKGSSVPQSASSMRNELYWPIQKSQLPNLALSPFHVRAHVEDLCR